MRVFNKLMSRFPTGATVESISSRYYFIDRKPIDKVVHGKRSLQAD